MQAKTELWVERGKTGLAPNVHKEIFKRILKLRMFRIYHLMAQLVYLAGCKYL